MVGLTPDHARADGRSPAATPNSTGTESPIRLKTGEARLIGPIASERYISEAPAAPHTPAAAPHARSTDVGLPGMNGMHTNSTATAPGPANAATRVAGARLAASPPEKSATPQRSDDSAAIP